jgi:hypothetical protein
VVTRIERGRLVLDLRTVRPVEDGALWMLLALALDELSENAGGSDAALIDDRTPGHSA